MSTQPQALGAPNADLQGKGVPGNGADGYKPSAPPGAQWPPNVQKGQYTQMSGKDGNILSYPAGVPTGHNAVTNRGWWHFSLCVCCKDCDSCCEAWCCTPCQLSRQCNMLANNRKEIHWPYCLLMTFCDYTLFIFSVSCIFVSETRRMARERYGISGSTVEDCCYGYWCTPCSTQQVLLEMTLMNEFPGATCYEVTSHPAGRRMV
ncbi:putative PLAC8 family [Leishmania shawi]|uniref:PLAC8 family n=1 Tax=Leishmania shawi TaxID=5680 RepID=A0AAW3BK24_9TRYP